MSYFNAAKLGTHIRLPDGREATTVYNGLDGIGIKFGIHYPKEEDFTGTSGNVVDVADDSPALVADWSWKPEALLRGSEMEHHTECECVGEDYEIITVNAL